MYVRAFWCCLQEGECIVRQGVAAFGAYPRFGASLRIGGRSCLWGRLGNIFSRRVLHIWGLMSVLPRVCMELATALRDTFVSAGFPYTRLLLSCIWLEQHTERFPFCLGPEEVHTWALLCLCWLSAKQRRCHTLMSFGRSRACIGCVRCRYSLSSGCVHPF